MKIRIWGCRGSIPSPGSTTLRYGGNTTCLEIRTNTGQLIIVDAGSGLRNLGRELMQGKRISPIRFFLTHSHWDHLIGFPFFQPAYSENFAFTFCSGPHEHGSIRKFLIHQMEEPYFPIPFTLLKGKFDFHCQRPNQEPGHCSQDGLEIIPIPLNHPNRGYGYKFIEQGKTFVFLTDNEIGFQFDHGMDRSHYVAFCRDADLLFHDAQYTAEEYRLTRGWGHSTFGDATDLAIEAGVKRLGLFHHDPDRTDDDLDRQVEFCQERIRLAGGTPECFAAAEGMEIELVPRPHSPG